MQEYKNDAPAGDHSEAEEDNDAEDKAIPKGSNMMTEVSDYCNVYSSSCPLWFILCCAPFLFFPPA